MTDYNKIIANIGTCNSLNDILSMRDENDNDFFKDYRLKFYHPLIEADASKKVKLAQELAILIVKVEKAKKLNKGDIELQKEFEGQESANTIAYQVLNERDNLVEIAYEHLVLASEHKTDTPQGKAEIEKKIKEIEGEVEKLKIQKAKKNRERRGYSNTKVESGKKLALARKGWIKKKNLYTVLQAMMDTNVTNAGDREILLEAINKTTGKHETIKMSEVCDGNSGRTTLEINDWSDENIFTPKEAGSLEIAEDLVGKKISGKSLFQILRPDAPGHATSTAKGFLDAITSTAFGVSPVYFETTVDNSHNQRVWNSKSQLEGLCDSFPNSFARVLREIGNDRLKAVVRSTSLSDNEKDKLCGYVDDILKYIYLEEEMTGVHEIYHGVFLEKYNLSEELRAKYIDNWQRTLLSRKLNHYPYCIKPEWNKLFEFMHKVFPATRSSVRSSWATTLENTGNSKWTVNAAPYLDDESNPNFLRPTNNNKDGNKNGWDNVTLLGYSENVNQIGGPGVVGTGAVVPASYYEKGGGKLGKWIKDNASTKTNLKRQQDEKAYTVGNNMNFKGLVKIWWDTLGDIIVYDGSGGTLNFRDSDYGWQKTGPGSQLTAREDEQRRLQNSIRFIKTMREILFKSGLITDIDDLDYYLIRVADMKEKSTILFPVRTKLMTDVFNFRAPNKILTKEVWNEDYEKYGEAEFLLEDIKKDEKYIAYLETSEDKVINNLIEGLYSDVTKFQGEIDAYENRILTLKALLEFDELPPEDKLKKIEELYAAQVNGKWKLSEIDIMIGYIENLKSQLNDDEYDSKLKPKLAELKKVKKAARIADPGYLETKRYTGMAKTGDDKGAIKALKKAQKENPNPLTLEKVRDAYLELAKHVNLETDEQTSLDAIKAEITNPTQDDDDTPPVSELKPEKLQELLNYPEKPSDAVLNKWKDVLTGKGKDRTVANNTINSEDKLEALIDKTGYSKKDSASDDEKKIFTKWEDHLKNHCTGPAKATKDKGDDQWNEFIKKDPKDIIGAILYFEYEISSDTEKERKRNEMKQAKIDEEAKDNVEKVEDDWDEKDQKHMTRYLYRTAVGKKLFDNIKTKTQDDPGKKPGPNDGNGDEKEMSATKEWLGFGHVGKSLLAYGLIFLLIFGGVAAFFWKSIMEWWNGPAEEEGEVGEDEKEETEEE